MNSEGLIPTIGLLKCLQVVNDDSSDTRTDLIKVSVGNWRAALMRAKRLPTPVHWERSFDTGGNLQ